MIITVDFLNTVYRIRKCTLEDIDNHYNTIRQWVGDTEEDLFKQRMIECVEANTAVTLTDNMCYLYYLNYKPRLAEGRAMYGKGVPKGMLALLMGTFAVMDKATFKMDFTLHAGKYFNEYKNLLTYTSIRRSLGKDRPLVIRIDDLRRKLDNLARIREESWVL